MAHRWTDQPLLAIFTRFPPEPENLIFRTPTGRPESEYENEVANPFARWFGSPSRFTAEKDILDVGFGFGGRPVRFIETGARSVAGVEIDEAHVDAARAFASTKGVNFDARLGLGESLPFPDQSFDLITMYDVMEHVFRPRDVLAECLRVLRPSGQVAVVFPPYYSLFAGSHLHGYATSIPGLNLLFSTRALRSATRRHLDQTAWPWRDFLRDAPTDKLWNMNGLTVRGFRRLVAESAFEMRTLRYFATRDHRTSSKSRRAKLLLLPAFLFFEALAATPILREVFCSRLVAILEKPREGV